YFSFEFLVGNSQLPDLGIQWFNLLRVACPRSFFVFGIELLLQIVFALEQGRADTLANVRMSFVQEIKQASGSGPLACLQCSGVKTLRRPRFIELHQQVDIKLIKVVISRKV